jgi:DNA ligase (NAD+)
MNIEGLGPEVIFLLHKNGFLNTLPSIYKIKNSYDQLIKLENLGEKSVKKLLSSIEESKNRSLDKFIFGLGIRHVGQKLSKLISLKIHNIKQIENID